MFFLENNTYTKEDGSFKEVLDQLDEALIWIAADGKIIKVNHSAIQKTGYPEKRLLSMAIYELCENFTSIDWSAHMQKLERSQRTSSECVIRTNEGLIRPLTVKSHLVRNECTTYVCAIAKDLSHTEREAEQIERMIYEYNMLNYRLSHDLRSPISTILGLINLAKMDSSPQQHEYLIMMESALQKQNSLMKNMYHLSSIHSARLRHEPVNFPEFINKLISEIPHKNQNSSSWSFHFSQNHLFRCDHEMLMNLLRPIVVNACQFSGKPDQDPCVEISVRTDAEGAVVDIADNGEGIDIKFRYQIFEMFFRGSARSDGSGLGLYLAKSAANRLNARISFDSDHEGTTFRIRIPDLK